LISFGAPAGLIYGPMREQGSSSRDNAFVAAANGELRHGQIFDATSCRSLKAFAASDCRYAQRLNIVTHRYTHRSKCSVHFTVARLMRTVREATRTVHWG